MITHRSIKLDAAATNSRRTLVASLAALWIASGPACDGCNPPPPPPPADAGCTAGTQGCPCNAGQCGGGLECRDDLCQPAVQQVGVVVSSPDARACELLLDHATDVQAAFASTLQGKGIHEGERLALAFTATTDAAIATGAVQLTLKAGSTASLATVEVLSSSCFGHDGAALAGASVSLNLGH